MTPVDITGRELKVGLEVAFCLAGTGTTMRLGVITDVAAKTVLISHMVQKYRGLAPVRAFTRRAFDAVCLTNKEVPNG